MKELGSTPTLIRSVRRAAMMLEFLARKPTGSTATETARALGIPVPTAYHLLNTLLAEGLLSKDGGRRYQLGPKVGLLAEAFLAQVSAPEYLVNRVRDLADRTGETAYLSAWRNGDALVLAIIEGRRAVRVASLHLGYSGVAHARASGKVLLAFAPPGTLEEYLRSHLIEARTDHTLSGEDQLRAELEEARRVRYALDEEGFAEGVACVAAPVADGSIAIGVSAPIERYRETRKELIEAVVAIAATASAPQLARAAEG
jgi:IclR family acetate operon transcriptional repressor